MVLFLLLLCFLLGCELRRAEAVAISEFIFIRSDAAEILSLLFPFSRFALSPVLHSLHVAMSLMLTRFACLIRRHFDNRIATGLPVGTNCHPVLFVVVSPQFL